LAKKLLLLNTGGLMATEGDNCGIKRSEQAAFCALAGGLYNATLLLLLLSDVDCNPIHVGIQLVVLLSCRMAPTFRPAVRHGVNAECSLLLVFALLVGLCCYVCCCCCAWLRISLTILPL
jgi:hypothetical protein